MAPLAPGGDGDLDLLFDMYESGSYPRYAFDADPTGSAGNDVYYSISQQAGAAPSGNDAVRYTGIGVASGPQDVGTGWAKNYSAFDPSEIPQGAARYARWSTRLVGAQNWQKADGGGRSGHKAFIIGNGCESYPTPGEPTRGIIFEEGFNDTDPFTQAHCFGNQNIGCGGGGVYNVGLSCDTTTDGIHGLTYSANDTWFRIQVKFQSSSNLSTADGYVAIWIRAFGSGASYAENAPDAESRDPFVFSTLGWWNNTADCGSQFIAWGPHTLRPFHLSAAYVQDWAEFQYATAFDPSWATRTSW